ncbi:MAG: RT0821/Lpp0805 family surface protein [Rhodospirillales bacterium]
MGLPILAACTATDEEENPADKGVGTAIVVLSTVAGGLVGLQLATGIVALAGGGGLGYLGGKKVNRKRFDLTRVDLEVLDDHARSGLDREPDGSQISWENAETRVSGLFRPLRTFNATDGRFCRQFRMIVTTPLGFSRAEGVACRTANGGWEVVLAELAR